MMAVILGSPQNFYLVIEFQSLYDSLPYESRYHLGQGLKLPQNHAGGNQDNRQLVCKNPGADLS
jgi:hypothetical protein